MTTEIFSEWFKKFCAQVSERPLLLIYDGHLSHVSVDLMETANAKDITLVKLPPHVTDTLQPLDVCGFGPLKRAWMDELNSRVNVLGPKETISKATFVDLLCKIWHKGLTKENMRSGFKSTGIYPLDRTKYPTSRFDARLLKRFNQWVALGKPDDCMEELAASINTPTKLKTPERNTPVAETRNTPIADDNGGEIETALAVSTPVAQTEPSLCSECESVGPKPPPIPGKVWVRGWTLINEPKPTSANNSFEELVLNKMKGPQEKKVKQRKKIDRKTKVITDAEYLEELKKHEDEME